jgi:hypothetical protein
MAKNTAGRGSGNSKLRFIMLEAEIADGDFTQITQAITNALKPPAPVQRALIGPGPLAPGATAAPVSDEAIEIEVGQEPHSDAPVRRAPRTSGTARVYRTPQRLDLDLSAFEAFAKAKNPPDDFTKRHLVAAFWFKEFFNTPNVTIDHAYSAYITAGWSAKIKDFDQPFRILKRNGLVKRVEPGVYTITLPGMGEVREMGIPLADTSKAARMDASA